MSHGNWRDAVADIRAATGPVSQEQQQLAQARGETLSPDLPSTVAAARLRVLFANELNTAPAAEYTDEQLAYLSSLETAELRIPRAPRHRQELDAWVAHLRLVRRADSLEDLQLEAGDFVEVISLPDKPIEEVSSIGSDGRVYFKGGAGASAWPDQLRVRGSVRRPAADADDLRRAAANNGALRARREALSIADLELLAEFRVDDHVTEEDIRELEEAIENADDEKPIQEFLESRPQLLVTLLRGRDRFCIPKARLAGKYVTDFMLADADSLGIRWVLVELETPRSSVTLLESNQLDKNARKGLSQVTEWREWLLNNLASARQPRKKDGLGLVDIRPESQGIVLVGRRAALHENAEAVRTRIREKQDVHVHTYEWLVESLRGVLGFRGPPGINPFML